MRIYFMFLLALFTFSCNSLKNFEESPTCPEGYDCMAEIIPNKSINVLSDTIGEKYIRLEDSEDFHTIKYTYSYKGKPELSDDSYQEEIYFQIPVDTEELTLENKALSQTNLIVSKQCFCRDSGFESIKQGQLTLNKKKSTYYISLDFVTDKNMKLKGLKTKVSL